MLRRRLAHAALLIAACTVSTFALAQNAPKLPDGWPAHPLRILVGFPAGSSPDLVARALQEPLSKALGQPVIVENHPGASGNIAADMVAKAHDDYTVGLMINGNLTIAKLLNPAVPYDPARDLAPIGLVGTAPLVLAAPEAAPGHDAKQFFAAAREAGDKWSYGSPGVGTVGHLGMELLKAKSGINPVHVPYQGNPQVINAMLSGQVNLALLPPGLATAQIKAGKLKAIGVTSAGRSPLVPDIPSLADAGIRDYQLEIWTALAASKRMPHAIVDRLSTLVGEIVRTPAMRQRLFVLGWEAVGSSPEGLANRMKSDTAQLGAIIKARGIRVD